MPSLVSVIIPVYNAEKYIERCINSLSSQSYREIEIVVVDDGSRDKSGEICDRLSNGDPRIRVHHQENSGVVAARLQALEISKGEYVTFVDADDYVDTDYIDSLLRPIVEQGVEMTCCQYYKTVNGKDFPQRRKERGMMDRQRIHKVLATDFIFDQQTKVSGVPLFLWGKMMSRQMAKTVIEQGKGMWYGEDAAGILLMAYRLNSLYVLDEPLYHYVTNPGQAIRKTGRKRWDANVKLWQTFIDIDTEGLLRRQLSYRVAFNTRKYLNQQALMAPSYRAFHQEMSYALDTNIVREYFLHVKLGNMGMVERFYNFMIRHRWDYVYYVLNKLRGRK